MSSKAKTKNRKFSVMLRAALVAVIVVTICLDYFNFGYLQDSPFEREITWEEPNVVVSNDEGYVAVLDSMGTRITIISPENEVKATIQHNSFANATPQYVDRICMDDENVYLLDHSISKKEKNSAIDRILVYEFDGAYKKTAYSNEKNSSIKIKNIAAGNGKLYAVINDSTKKKITVGSVNASELKKIHTYKYKNKYSNRVVFSAYYYPENDTTDVLTEQGDVLSWTKNGKKEYTFAYTDVLLSDVTRAKNGRIYGVDFNQRAIVSIQSGGKVKRLVKSHTLKISEKEGELLYTNLENNSICRYDINQGKIQQITEARYSAHEYFMRCITWIVTILGIAALLLLMVLVAFSVVERIKASKGKKSDPIEEKGIITNRQLYGPALGITAAVFIISSIMLGSLYYDKVVNMAKDSTENSSYIISELSAEGFGDKMAQINSQEDCGSEEYQSVVKSVKTICMNYSDVNNEASQGCQLYNFDEESGDLITVFDSFGMQRTGTRLSEQDREKMSADFNLQEIKEDKMSKGFIVYENDTKYYQTIAPVKNSKDEFIGISIILTNYSQLCKNILADLLMKIIQLFTLLFGLVLLLVEFRVAQMFYKIKRKNARNGEADKIIPESFRTLDVFFRIPEKLFVIFLTIMATEFVRTTPIQYSFILIALPFTLESVSYFIFRVFMGNVVKYKPRKYAFISGACNVISAGVLLLAMQFENYYFLLISGSFAGFASATGLDAVKTIRLANLPATSEKYSYIVPERKPMVATAIAASIGTVMRSVFGEKSIVIFMILMALITVLAAYVFITDKLNMPYESKAERRYRKSILEKSLIVLKRPNAFVYLILVAIPVSFFGLFGSYMLPQVNAMLGNPEIFVGALSIIVSIIFIMTRTKVWDIVNRDSSEKWPPVMMGLLAVMMFIFGLLASMRLFFILLIGVSITEGVLIPFTQRNMVDETLAEGFNPNDTTSIHEFCEAIGPLIGPIVLTLMMMRGVRFFGFVWCLILAVCAVLAWLIFRAKDKKEKKLSEASACEK